MFSEALANFITNFHMYILMWWSKLMTDRTLDASASKYGSADIKITNRGLTTTITIEAIQKYAGKQVDHLGPILIHQEMNREGVNNWYGKGTSVSTAIQLFLNIALSLVLTRSSTRSALLFKRLIYCGLLIQSFCEYVNGIPCSEFSQVQCRKDRYRSRY